MASSDRRLWSSSSTKVKDEFFTVSIFWPEIRESIGSLSLARSPSLSGCHCFRLIALGLRALRVIAVALLAVTFGRRFSSGNMAQPTREITLRTAIGLLTSHVGVLKVLRNSGCLDVVDVLKLRPLVLRCRARVFGVGFLASMIVFVHVAETPP